MPIGGSATEFNITGAKLKVSGGVQVSGSIAYTTDATGFGGVTAQIDGNNTLNITSGKLTGVTKIDRSTAATITAITHTNVNNNTTIHIALKNTSSTRGVFITLGTFASDDTVKVNYTDDYLIGPGETGMLTLRKVNGVLSLFAREMFSDKASTFTNDNTDGNRPFYIKDGVNYKYPLYKYTAAGLTSEVIQGTTYYKPTAGISTKSRPPKGIPENVTPPSASSFSIGNSGDLTTLEYSVLGVSSSFDYASITDGNNATQTRFLLTDGEASGTFTESGASSGDSYKLFIEKTNTNLTDTVTATSTTPSTPFAVFHHGTFANGGDPYSHGSVTAAATAGYFYSDTATGTYALGSLDEDPTFVQETALGGDGYGKTTYKFTTGDLTSVDHLLVAGGGGGGGDMGGGGGAGGYLETTGTTISRGQKTIVVGGGGIGAAYTNTASYRSRGRNGADTSVTGLTTAIGGGGGATGHNNSDDIPGGNGGSGGGGSGGRNENGGYGEVPGAGTAGQGFDGAHSGNAWYSGGGGGASQLGYGRNGTGGGNTTIGHGGDGKQSTITGFTSYYFAGGGGCAGHSTNGGNGGKGGGGGGGRGSATFGTGNTDGLTNGENGDAGVSSNTQEPPANTSGGAGGKHTGGGGGGGHHHQNHWGGVGGSGIVIIRTGGNITTGKIIPKVTDITLDPTNVSNVLISTQGTGISTVTYSVNSGSEVSTPVSQLSVAHGLAMNTTATLLAYALNASGARLGVKLSRSILPVYGYETFTITKHTNASTNLSITDNGTDNITSVYKNSGGNGWDTGFYTPTFTAPITFEFNKTAAASDNSVSYIRVGITDTPTVVKASGSFETNWNYYFMTRASANYYLRSGKGLSISDGSGAWDITKKHYIVYKTNGNLEFWNGNDLKKTIIWGTGKSVRFETDHHINSSTLTNQMTNLRMKRREWDGTKYIN